MFKKRHVEMKLVKDLKQGHPVWVDGVSMPKKPIVEQAVLVIREVAKGGALIVGTYIAADTVRRITVHMITTKI